MTITEFLEARIAEDEAKARAAIAPDEMYPYGDRSMKPTPPEGWGADMLGYVGGTWGEHSAQWNPLRVLAECAAKRSIIKLHEGWPVLMETQPVMERVPTDRMDVLTFRMSQSINWLTEQEYVKRFGTAPPAAPMIRALAAVYADHPDYQQEWSTS